MLSVAQQFIDLSQNPNPMLEKLSTLWPEIVLLITAVVVLFVGLTPYLRLRRGAAPITGIGLIIAGIIAILAGLGSEAGWGLAAFVKVIVCSVGFLMLLTAAEVPDESGAEPALAGQGGRSGHKAKRFDPTVAGTGEFFFFFLLSLIGVMLCAGTTDLIWLFLALELTSLPIYIMVGTARKHIEAPEACVKYFFLGAFSAAIFLYGFALLYGAAGSTILPEMQRIFTQQGVGTLAVMGMILAILGIAFKIAAVPMHAYAADVYEGAATPVTAFLAFAPKAAGFVALILLLGLFGWPLPSAITWLLWALAVATMTIGNTLALLQDNVKRVLAYSSIAHSGYMLIGLVAGPAIAGEGLMRNGIAAVLFYLFAYGLMNLGAFAVLAMLRRRGEEAQTFDDLRGLHHRHPFLALVMVLCVLSLTGIPPLVGFWGKVFLFGSAISAGFVVLAVLGVINSAIAAVYYLRIVGVCVLSEEEDAQETGRAAPLPWRRWGVWGSAAGVAIFSFIAAPLMSAAGQAASVPIQVGTAEREAPNHALEVRSAELGAHRQWEEAARSEREA